MNLLSLLSLLAVAVAVAFFTVPSLRTALKYHGLKLAMNASVDCEGPTVTRLADATHTDYILVKRGATPATGYDVCGVADQPFALALDTVATGETGLPRALLMLGLAQRNVPVRVSEASTVGENAYTAANGRVQSGQPATAGTYWHVGRHTKAQATAGELGEIEPCQPRKVVVIANAASLATTQAAMLDGATVIVLAS
jgi:hypothetical protein